MQQHMKRYIRALGLAVVTLAVVALAASAVPNPVDPPLHDTLFVNCPGFVGFTTIQGAVNAADAGDTIKVCEGTYTENVTVNDAVKLYDSLRIKAEDDVELKCPVVGSGIGIDLHANRVQIEGFNIEHCNNAAIAVESGFGGELFDDNNLEENFNGIRLSNSSGNNSVVYNEISENSNDGVFDFTPGGDDFFFSNEVEDNGRDGIEISTTSTCAFPCVVIVDNKVTDNGSPSADVGVGNGVYLNHADKADVKWNKLSDNTRDGLYSNTSLAGKIYANDADKNGRDGIEFSSAATGNTVQDNRMQKNKNFDADDHDTNTWTNNHCVTHGGNPAIVCFPE